MNRVGLYGVLILVAACFPEPSSTWSAEPTAPPLAFKEGERVVFIGDAFTERLQEGNYLETALVARFPDREVKFRNLGWSGDTVFGEARAVFGKAADGFNRLLKDVRDCQPTLIVACYGANECQAGKPGLPRFIEGLNRLLDELQKTGARVVLLSPQERERLSPPLPDPASHNVALAEYSAAVQSVAGARGLSYVSLLGLVPRETAAPLKPLDQLTHNGLHFSPYGYWRITPLIEARCGLMPWRWSVEISGGKAETTGTAISQVQAGLQAVSFTAQDAQLPLPLVPPHAPVGAEQFAPPRTLKVQGLEAGKYELKIDDQSVATATHEQWAAGVRLSAGPEFTQVEQMRALIAAKNQLYFHRYRPENETYLFLFRKGEQGNNAVEIPQFDPLVAEKEQQIAALRKPKPHVYKLAKLP